MKTTEVNESYFSAHEDKGLVLITQATVFITKEKALKYFDGKLSGNEGEGLFAFDAIKDKFCLTVMPDSKVKISLTKKQVDEIKKLL